MEGEADLKLEEHMSAEGVVYYKVGILGVRKEHSTQVSGKFKEIHMILGELLWCNLVIEDHPPIKISADWARANEPMCEDEPPEVLVDNNNVAWLVERASVIDRIAPLPKKTRREKVTDQLYDDKGEENVV
jgi:hypothetical protein